jgi:Prenyltransferase and squalene oxidase repeat
VELGARLARARERGLAALCRLQRDGVFPLEHCRVRPAATAVDSTFCTGSTLLACGEALPRPVLDAAVDVIRRRRRPDGHWAWFPDDTLACDADSTALGLAVLIRFRDEPAASAEILREYWREPDGPFRTYLDGPLAIPHRDDPVVNCNVVYCLRLAGLATEAEIEVACAFAGHARFGTHYYPFPTTLGYTAARADVHDPRLAAALDAVQPERLAPLQLAELVATGRGSREALELLLAQQRSDGSWEGTVWFTDHMGGYCSDAYSTAVAVEALSRELDRGARPPSIAPGDA